MSILDNEGHDPNGLGNHRPSLDVQASIAAMNGKIARLERALIEIEHHSTDKNAAATARAALALEETQGSNIKG